MAKFLTNRATTLEIENIIKNSKNWLVLISPFIKFPGDLLQRLKDADRRKVRIELVYGKTEMKPDVRSQLEQLENLSLYFLQNLHAKCYYNEEHMVITSLNLLDSSEHNSEMGILLSPTEDASAYKDAVEEARLIINSATKDDLGTPGSKYSYTANTETSRRGYCIRCGIGKRYDLEKPLCDYCFDVWAGYGDPNYKEEFCHRCGKPALTTKIKPLCHSCYDKLQR